jgi:CRP-like cAMP-binding protein
MRAFGLESLTMTPEDRAAVRRSQLFGMLPDAAVEALIGDARPEAVEKGAAICRQGAPAESCFLILDGVVKLYREGRGAPGGAVLALHGPGRAFFVGEALAGSVLPASAEAVTPARLLALDAARMRTAIASDHKIARAMLAAAAHNLRLLVSHIEALKTKTAPARLADFILGLAAARDGTDEIVLPCEKQLVADRLGVTPVSLSRALAQLARHGVVVRRDKILIHDLAALRDFAS